MNRLFNGFITAATTYWSGLEDKLGTMGTATNEFLHVVQDFWYIPLTISLIIVFCLVLAGGKQGRIQAKSFAWIVLLATAGVMMIPTLVGLVTTIFAKEQTTITRL